MRAKQAVLVPTAIAFIAVTTLVSATLVVEYDAARNVGTTGGLVDTWSSAAGSLRTATPSGGDPARRPTLVSDVFSAGQPGIQFDANTNLVERDLLTFANSALPDDTNDFTIVTAIRLRNLEQGGNIRPTWFAYGAQGGGPFHTVAVGVDRPVGGNDLLFRMNGTDVHSNIPLGVDTNYVTIITRSGSSNYTFDVMDQDGVLSTTGVDDSLDVILGGDVGKIGNLVVPPHGDFAEAGLDGYIGLIQVYDTALSSGERSNLLAQLNSYVFVLPEVNIATVEVENVVGLQFQTDPGLVYRLDSTTNLVSSNNFQSTGAFLEGDGEVQAMFDPTGFSTTKNYRVVIP